MGILDFLKSYLPEDTKGMPEDQAPDGLQAENLDYLNPLLDKAKEFMAPVPEQKREPFNYHDTFMRTPDNVDNAKAAEQLRNLINPQPKAEQLFTPMSDAQMSGEPQLTEAPVAPKAPAPKVEKKHVSTSKEETREPAEQRKPSTLEALLEQFGKGDKELEDAMEKRRSDLQLAGLAEAASQIGTAMGTGGQKTFKELDPDGFKNLREMAQLRVDEVKEKRKAKTEQIAERQNIINMAKSELDYHQEEDKTNPDSDASKMYRDVIKAAMPELKIPENISAANLEKLIGPLQNAANLKLAMESKKEVAAMNNELRKQAQEERNIRNKEREENNTFKEQERYQGQLSKIDTKNREATKYMDEATAMADQATSNPQAALNLARGVIKAIEGAGARVSDKDFSSAVGDQALGAKALDTINKLSKGTIRNVTKKDVMQMLDASKKIQQQKYEEAVRAEVQRYSKRAKVSPEEAATLGVVPKAYIHDQSDTVKVRLPDGREGTIPRAQLEAAKANGAKEI